MFFLVYFMSVFSIVAFFRAKKKLGAQNVPVSGVYFAKPIDCNVKITHVKRAKECHARLFFA